MSNRLKCRAGQLPVWLSIVVFSLPIFLATATPVDNPQSSGRHIYIAFGFHVNLYHSFRNDTNDDGGVAKDIRVIRHIIQTLDRYNAMGVPVKGVWDFDNLFSLQELLPRYAPDIIEDIRRRINSNGDEVILMSYNNGLASAMTQRELDDAVRWSISNPWQSGVKDLFGTFSPIVRPQEMMTTPGNFSIYRKYGIQAVSLYYSATPFDAFRVFSRPLNRTEAHNPILYRHPDTMEEMVVIPTYHFGDLVDHVGLRRWAGELRELQESGELTEDALIFINFDADSELWHGLDLPGVLSWLPNTSGIEGLVEAARGLPYVRFTTVGDYLEHHSPVGTFYFSQDTADGSFNGYSSWAEKAASHRHWTIIERNRRSCAAAEKAMAFLKEAIDTAPLEKRVAFSYMKRLRALSTTHFGLSTPYLARQREHDTATLMEDLDGDSRAIMELVTAGLRDHLEQQPPLPPEGRNGLTYLDTMMVLNMNRGETSGSDRFLKIPIPNGYEPDMKLILIRSDGKELVAGTIGAAPETGDVPSLLLFVDEPQSLTDGIYRLYAAVKTETSSSAPRAPPDAGLTGMSNGRISVHFNRGEISGIFLDGVEMAASGSLTPRFLWRDDLFRARIDFSPPVEAADGGSVTTRITGPFPGPSGQTLSDGWVDYRLTLPSGLPYLILQGSLRYPATAKPDIFKAAFPEIIRRTDLGWQEVMPAEVRFSPRASRKDPVRILKRNYLGVSTEYSLDYFRYSDLNLNLDNINNHITESYMGLVAGAVGMGIAMDVSEQSNFAFSPLKMRYDTPNATFAIRANPFGTYYGRQYRPLTWGNGNGFDATLLAGEQYASAAPSYNGASSHFSLLFAFFSGRQMPDEIRQDLIDFANPPFVAMATVSAPVRRHRVPESPSGFLATYQDGAVQFSWDGDRAPDTHYRIRCGAEPGVYEAVYPAVGNTLRVDRYAGDKAFAVGSHYYAVIESVIATDRVSGPSQEIRFTITPQEKKTPEVPLELKLRVLWASLHAWLASLDI
jgi:hypothetical protein